MHNRHRERNLVSSALIATGLIIAAAVVVVIIGIKTHSRPTAETPSANRPSADEVAKYQVPPANPKYIAIPAINVKQTRVLPLGLTSVQQIAVPGNLFDTGWYDSSGKPGKAGAMFIYGHLSSWQANGIFYDLKKLHPGDRIIITRGDNASFTYQVVSSKLYPTGSVNMHEVLTPVDTKIPGLNLMTCAGKLDKNSGEFSQRLVVFAKQVN